MYTTKFFIALNLLSKALRYRSENRKYGETKFENISQIKIWFTPYPEIAAIYERSYGMSGPYDNGWRLMRQNSGIPFQCYLED